MKKPPRNRYSRSSLPCCAVKPHDVAHLLHEKRIGRELEVALAMGLQAERPPDAVYRRFRKLGLACDLPHTPVRAAFRLRLQRLAHQLGHPFITDRSGTAWTQLDRRAAI